MMKFLWRKVSPTEEIKIDEDCCPTDDTETRDRPQKKGPSGAADYPCGYAP